LSFIFEFSLSLLLSNVGFCEPDSHFAEIILFDPFLTARAFLFECVEVRCVAVDVGMLVMFKRTVEIEVFRRDS
jgi:hypothetical protein